MRETWKCLYLVSKLHNLGILYNVFILKSYSFMSNKRFEKVLSRIRSTFLNGGARNMQGCMFLCHK